MNTPKRYEEMARELYEFVERFEPSFWDSEGNMQHDPERVAHLANALRTAAREAQVRVLEELEGRIDGYEVVFDSLRERLDSGEDL